MLKRAARWTLVLLLGIVAVVAVLIGVLMRMVPSDEELAARIEKTAGQKLGVKVTVRSAHLQVWPRPEFVLADVATDQEQPISLRLLVTRPQLSDLLRHRLSFPNVDIDGAVIPVTSLHQLHIDPTANGASIPLQLRRLRFQHLTWITRRGKELEFEGEARIQPDWQLQDLQLLRSGVKPVARITLARQDARQWDVKIQVGGGTADGQAELARDKQGRWQLSGKLAPHEIEVASALDAFRFRSAVSGKASGETIISASGESIGEVASSLHTRTQFSMGPATLLHIDVEKAIRTVGKEHAGRTALRTLTGQVDTQNSRDGLVVRYSGLQARGDSFTAKGGGTVANRRLDG